VTGATFRMIVEYSLLEGPEIVPCFTKIDESNINTEVEFDGIKNKNPVTKDGITVYLNEEEDKFSGELLIDFPASTKCAYTIWLKNRFDDDELDFGKELPDIKVKVTKNQQLIGITRLVHEENRVVLMSVITGSKPQQVTYTEIPAGLWMVGTLSPYSEQLSFTNMIFPRSKIIYGLVFNHLQFKPVIGAEIYLNGQLAKVTNEEGRYSIPYFDMGKYSLKAIKDIYKSDSIWIDIKYPLPKLQNLALNIAPPPPPVMIVYLSKDFYLNFAQNSDQILSSPGNAEVIQDIVKYIKTIDRLAKVTVVGHTDSDGSSEYNYDLSFRRAQSTVDALVAGFESIKDKISASGKGEDVPLAPNDTPENKARNRRVEVKLEYVK